jgi:hypothetical protein
MAKKKNRPVPRWVKQRNRAKLMRAKVTAPKELKGYAHWLAEQVFGSWYDVAARKRMYAWLHDYSSTGHIGSMTEFELKAIIRKLKQML